MATQVEYILEHGQAGSAMAAPVAAAVPAGRATAAAPTDKIELVKEDLVVGKRAVEQGGVRLTTHVVETPVEEQVRLRKERVMVDRRPINRPLTGVVADAFRERTLSVTARSQEAVVGKEARVVEEISLRKESAERVETVRDTVRETKVDVEQVPGSVVTRSTTVGVPGEPGALQPGALRDNAATRAVDSTLGTNVSGENPARKS